MLIFSLGKELIGGQNNLKNRDLLRLCMIKNKSLPGQLLNPILTAAYLILLTALSGCGRYYVEVYQKKIDATDLASTEVNTPDPRQEHPPYGQMLTVEWQLPQNLLVENPLVMLDVIFWDNIERHYVWPVQGRKGFVTLPIINKQFEKTGGVLAYRARILTEEGTVFREWRHQLWVNLISMDEQPTPPPQSKGASLTNQDKDL
jgi:hypothetical protein